jgi:hypothetical protein
VREIRSIASIDRVFAHEYFKSSAFAARARSGSNFYIFRSLGLKSGTPIRFCMISGCRCSEVCSLQCTGRSKVWRVFGLEALFQVEFKTDHTRAVWPKIEPEPDRC